MINICINTLNSDHITEWKNHVFYVKYHNSLSNSKETIHKTNSD